MASRNPSSRCAGPLSIGGHCGHPRWRALFTRAASNGVARAWRRSTPIARRSFELLRRKILASMFQVSCAACAIANFVAASREKIRGPRKLSGSSDRKHLAPQHSMATPVLRPRSTSIAGGRMITPHAHKSDPAVNSFTSRASAKISATARSLGHCRPRHRRSEAPRSVTHSASPAAGFP